MKKIVPPYYHVALLQDRVYRKLRDVLSYQVGQFDINLSEWAILGQLYAKKTLITTELAFLLAVEAPYITRMLKLLDKKGLVEQGEDTEDKRSHSISLTAKGKQLVEQLEKQLAPLAKNLLKTLSPRLALSYMKALETLDTVTFVPEN